MNTTCDYLDALRVRYGISSDYALAKFLKTTHSSVSHYRTGKTALSDDMTMKVADLLDLPRAEVYLSIQAERAAKQKNAPVFDALSDALRRLGGIAAAALLFVALSGPGESIASVLNFSPLSSNAEMRLSFDNNMDYRKLIALYAAWLSGFTLCRFSFIMRGLFSSSFRRLDGFPRVLSPRPVI